MKNAKSLLMILSMIGLITFTSCTEDGDLGSPVSGPSISLVPGAGLVSDVDTVGPGESFKVIASAASGTVPLAALTIKEDGATISDLSRLFINGNPVQASPLLLSGNDKDGFSFEIDILAHEEAEVTKTYTLEVTDEDQMRTSASVDITTVANVTELTGKLLLNQAGPAGQGGINLTTGDQTGTVSTDPTAADGHIKDEGIDLDKVAAENWKQQISGMNGSEIKIPADGLVFADIKTPSQVQGAYDDAGATLVGVTGVIEIGDVILVKNGDNYWAVEVTNLVLTVDNNSDYYELSIKY